MTLSLALLVQALIAIFISGILYSFSDFIIKALNNLPSKNAVEVMQNINVTVFRSLFMVSFILLVPTSVATVIWSIIASGWWSSLFVTLGMLFYVFGMFIVTGMGNVPLNESLKKVNVSNSVAESVWRAYYMPWSRLNMLRCLCGVLAGVSWMIAAYRFA